MFRRKSYKQKSYNFLHFLIGLTFNQQNQTISHLEEIKTEPNVRALLQQVCDLVQREELNASLITLELLDNTGPSTAHSAPPPTNEPTGADSLPKYLIAEKLFFLILSYS